MKDKLFFFTHLADEADFRVEERRTGVDDFVTVDVDVEGTGVPLRAAGTREVLGAGPEVVLVPDSNLTLALGFAALRVRLGVVLVGEGSGGGGGESTGATGVTGVVTSPPLVDGTGDTTTGAAGDSTDPPRESWP